MYVVGSFIWFSERTVNVSLNIINRLIFIAKNRTNLYETLCISFYCLFYFWAF